VQMDDMTQQNAALVEEAAAAAEAMQGQAEALIEAVSVFQLRSDQAGRESAAARPAPVEIPAASRTLAPSGNERKLPRADVDEEGDWKEF
jgi:methyl-accepting chemotaxis protein